MRRARLTRRKAIVGILVFGALIEAGLAIAVLAKDEAPPQLATALPMHPVAGTFKPDDTKLADCEESRRCTEQAFGNVAYYNGPAAALARFDDRYGDFSDPTCHRVAHTIGSATLARNKGNVARTFAEGSSSCFSGFYHGVLERSLNGVRGYQPETLGAVARDLCREVQESASSWLAYQCLHGLGHGLMITTGYTLPLSLKACDRLETPWARTSCNGGVFMENISTLYGFKSRFVRDDDPVYPCNAVAEEDKIKCYEIVTSRILRVLNGDWSATARYCATAEENWVTACFRSLGRDSAARAHEDPVKILELCWEARDTGGEADCIDGAARAMTGNVKNGKPAAVLCESAASEYRTQCYYGIGSVMALYRTTDAARRADCQSLMPAARH
ncbi:MAG: hypothetical protein ACRELC_04405, partial [Gemmatimonadota bacterium]